ncbi:hypothetical protein C1H76_0384 [Elsinoe australis]|uniref:DUF7726 domain-containing protein n=1 Tax=Elsinoe australis TaxID=40998 RepID=A0A4U7BEL2_9PEZI|nr:hypothetical protein C1H76_0384 [Elsinoe australis]
MYRKQVSYQSAKDPAPLAPRDPNVTPARRDSTQESPNKGKKRSHEEVDPPSEEVTSPKSAKQKKTTDKSDKSNDKKTDYDVSGIRLDGEEDNICPIFDTCQDIRKKINAEIRRDTTKAELARIFGAQFNPLHKISGSQLQRFLDKKGPFGGAESGVYYGAYVFFEKLRMKQGKPESKRRLQVKEANPNGMERTDASRKYVTCIQGERPYFDSVGRLTIR